MISHAELRRQIRYEPETGRFFRLVAVGPRGCHKPGEIHPTKATHGHLKLSVENRDYLAHRLAWFYMTGSWPKSQIDHRNGVPGDNRFANLRDVSPKINNENRRYPRSDNKVGLLGVSWDAVRQRFKAQIRSGRTTISKRFLTAAEAHAFYVETKRRLHEGCTI